MANVMHENAILKMGIRYFQDFMLTKQPIITVPGKRY